MFKLTGMESGETRKTMVNVSGAKTPLSTAGSPATPSGPDKRLLDERPLRGPGERKKVITASRSGETGLPTAGPTELTAGWFEGEEGDEKSSVNRLSDEETLSSVPLSSLSFHSFLGLHSRPLLASASRKGAVADIPTETRHALGVLFREASLTREASLMVKVIRGLFTAGKRYDFVLANAASLSSNGSGIVNAIIAVNVVALVTEFTSFAAIFDEFFVSRMQLHYMPCSRYQYPPGTALATQYANVPMGVASLHHGTGAYINLTGIAVAPTFKLTSTGDPFVFDWVNVENINSGVVVPSSTSSTQPCQGWCLTAASPSQSYTGQVQYLSGGGALVNSTVLGETISRYFVSFRCRA